MKITNASISLNDEVWVQLTARGWKIFNDYYSDLHLDPKKYSKPGTWQKFQLWELMNIYGPHCVMGLATNFFERMEVRLVAPAEVDE